MNKFKYFLVVERKKLFVEELVLLEGLARNCTFSSFGVRGFFTISSSFWALSWSYCKQETFVKANLLIFLALIKTDEDHKNSVFLQSRELS